MIPTAVTTATDAPVNIGASFMMKGFLVKCSAIVTCPHPLGVDRAASVPTITDTALVKPAMAPKERCTFFLSKRFRTMGESLGKPRGIGNCAGVDSGICNDPIMSPSHPETRPF